MILAKVGNYDFTTLEPNLGVMEDIVLADIPGLIEGASEGRGLGMKFLRHIQRTKILLHCISLESDDVERDYKIIREELKKYSKELIEKREIILLTKTDMVETKIVEQKTKQMLKINEHVLSVSIHDQDKLDQLKTFLLEALKD
jgi:GTP-binding protein